MQSPLQLKISLDWVQMETDFSKCELCGEVIISDMWQLVLFVDYEPMPKDHKICNNCYQEADEDDGTTETDI